MRRMRPCTGRGMTISRFVAAETLDQLAAADPGAQRSRRDLMRLHRVMGSRTIVARGWQALLSAPRARTPLKILELGAGDGSLLLGVARALAPAWSEVALTLLDRQDIVSRSTLAGFAELGWSARVEVADVLDWAAPPAVLPEPHAPAWDLITTSLFLHHFEGRQLDILLAAIAGQAEHFFACEPRRARACLAASHLVGAMGANRVTRKDAVLSVRAGFRAGELGALWPGRGSAWQVREYAAGMFSHCFSARRRGVA
jgi:hypothetical protein